jgi:hypothetical protein
MITICTWLWGNKFDVYDVLKLVAGVRRNLAQPHNFLCLSDRFHDIIGIDCGPIPDEDLTKTKGCFARLRMFDPEWQEAWMIGDRLVCIDLDTVITGKLDPLFDRPEPFVIMQGGNAANPCPYNGALMMLRAGAHPEIWSDFSVEKAATIPHYEFPDDQGWIHHKVPDAPGWRTGHETGVYVFGKPGWPTGAGEDLPTDARLVTFNGARTPKKFHHLRWVREHWR